MSTPHDPHQWNQPPAYGPTGAGTPPGAPGTTPEDRTLAMVAHLSAPVGWIISAGWLSIVGPLVLWLMYKDRSWFVRNAAAGAFNFTITMWVVSIIGWFLTFTIILAPIGIPLILIGGAMAIVLGCMGAYRTYQGTPYVYPWQMRILS